MTIKPKRLAVGAACTLALALTGCGGTNGQSQSDENTVTFGVIPDETAEATLGYYQLFIDLFEEETGYEVDFYEATSFAAITEGAIAGDLDLVMLGPFAQVMARDNGADLEAVGALIESPDNPENRSIGVVRTDSGIEGLDDLEGENVCFIDPGSATGYLYPAAGFLDLGLDPETDLEPIFVGDHISVVQAMHDGECAAAFTHSGNPEFREHGVSDSNPDGTMMAIWDAEVPNPGISIAGDIEPEKKQTIIDAVMKLNGDYVMDAGLCPEDRIHEGEDGPYCHAIEVFWGVVDADDDYWDSLREVCEATKAPACEG